ncbi:MAG: tetratricopeptide repeat protein [Methylococcaceae bacterium]|nr:tetratricopeptide repeat protein [Methylococcaceae bacterium]
MKKYRSISKQTRTFIALTLLTTNVMAMAANYDLLNQQPNNFGGLDQDTISPNSSFGNTSILDSMQQEKINEKKRDFLEVLNLLKQNKLTDAENKLAKLLKQSPENPELYNLKALAETLKKDTVSADKSYQKAISIDKNNILAHLGLSKLALDTGDLAKSKEYADKAIAINSKIVNAYLILADIANKQKNNSEVESVLLTGLEKVKGNISSEIEIIQNLGKFYAAQKQPEKILSLSEDLLKRYPNNTKALSLQAGAQIVNNKKSLAEETLTQLIGQDKQDVNHRLLLAKLLGETPEKVKESIKLLDQALAIAPDKPEAYVFKTAYLIKLKQYPEAMDLANQTEKKFPALSIGKLLKGDIFLAQQKLDNALENYQQAYKKQPNDKVLFVITDILNAQKKLPDAVRLLNDELTKNSKNNAIHFKLATLYQQQNDFQQAEKHYKDILSVQPDNVLVLNNLAWIYSQGNNSQALELAKKAYTLAPESAAIADTYGHILVKQSQPEEGLKILEKSATLAPNSDDIQFHLAEAYAVNDQQAKAIEILERIVKSEQNFSEKKAAVELLEKLKKQ